MSTMQVALIIIAVCAAAIIGAGYGIFYATKKGVNIGAGISAADSLTDAVGQAFEKLKPLLPQHPAIGIIETIIDLADVGVNAAEKLYKTATIEKDQRKSEAKEFVLGALRAAGVEITSEIEEVVDGAITGAVAVLPKTHDENGNIIQ